MARYLIPYSFQGGEGRSVRDFPDDRWTFERVLETERKISEESNLPDVALHGFFKLED